VTHVPLLSPDETRSLRAAVLATRSRWRARRDALAFHTLGAAAHLDALDDPDAYQRYARLDNAFLRDRFPALYERLLEVLGRALGAPILFHDEFALPGFRIVHSQRGATLPLAAIRPDVPHLALSSAPDAGTDCISFSFDVSENQNESGVRVWSVAYGDTIGLDSEEVARVLDAAENVRCVHQPGALIVRRGDAYAQRLPMSATGASDDLITLEGRAFREIGTWRVYW
jgi:hypothetical protein